MQPRTVTLDDTMRMQPQRAETDVVLNACGCCTSATHAHRLIRPAAVLDSRAPPPRRVLDDLLRSALPSPLKPFMVSSALRHQLTPASGSPLLYHHLSRTDSHALILEVTLRDRYGGVLSRATLLHLGPGDAVHFELFVEVFVQRDSTLIHLLTVLLPLSG